MPSVARAARIAIGAGAHGITVHPRPDERHIRRADVHELAALLPPEIELNIEGYPSPEWLALVEEIRPAQATLVPDPPEALTSNAGWRFAVVDRVWLGESIARLQAAASRVSLFVDPEPAEVEGARSVGADRIELYTEPYASAYPTPARSAVFSGYRAAAEHALALGLGINAGHDLDLDNLSYFAAHIPGLLEVSIGHALISEALFRGLEATVRAYLGALGQT